MNKTVKIFINIEEESRFTETIGKYVATIFCKDQGGIIDYVVRDNNKNLLNVKILDVIGRHL